MNRELNSFKTKYLSGDIQKDIAFFKEIFLNDAMFRTRKINLNKNGVVCYLLFMDGMVNSEIINEAVLKPLAVLSVKSNKNLSSFVAENIVCANESKQESNIASLLSSLLYGDSVLLIENCKNAIIINTKGWRTRGISEPPNEQVSQGSREGFDEALMFNAATLRRRLATPDLKIEMLNLGRKTDTKIFICYIDSLVNKETLKKVVKKIKAIDIDGVLDTNYINELINRNRYTLFKTAGSTERPDTVAARLLEGRIAIMCDGTPVVLTIPYLFTENFQADDDYYTNFSVAAIGRVLRYLCFYIAITLPAIFIALSCFHPELLPTAFLNSIAFSRSGVPFSTFSEVILLIVTFEMLKETGLRMQQNSGHALSIVGGLVVGQAAVEARIVSAPVLIITALCGIAGLMVPRLKGAVFYCKIFLTVASSVFGLYGFFTGIVLLHCHLYSLTSFGIDYVSPSLEFSFSSLKDTLIRAPFSKMTTRPSSLTKNTKRLNIKK